MKPKTSSHRSRRAALAAALATVSIAAAACGGGSDGPPKQDANAELLVWTDATRLPAFEAYQKANPDVKMKVETVDPASMLSKIQLANRTGKGWPDVIFDSTPSDVASLASPLFEYAAPLSDEISDDVQAQFATNNAACTIDGELYCLQNDLAQDVLWYDKPLMKKFGYDVPTTWDEYVDLGKKVAAEHPGYVIGAVGDVNIYYNFLWGSGCPIAEVKGSNEVRINTADEKCTRVADALDPLLANGSVSNLSPFDPEMIELAKDGKVLMTPGPSWFGEFVLGAEASYNLPDGRIAVAPIPTWAGETTNYSGAWGGGIYLVSSHSKNLDGAVDIAEWVATSDEYQSTAPTYPAYIPAAETWSAGLAKNKFYAENPAPVLAEAAGKINPAVAPTRYQITPAITATLVAAIKDGQTIASALPALQTQLAGLAQTVGYEVTE